MTKTSRSPVDRVPEARNAPGGAPGGLLDRCNVVPDAAAHDLLHPTVHRGYLAGDDFGVRDEERQQPTIFVWCRGLSRPQALERTQVCLPRRIVADQVVG